MNLSTHKCHDIMSNKYTTQNVQNYSLLAPQNPTVNKILQLTNDNKSIIEDIQFPDALKLSLEKY